MNTPPDWWCYAVRCAWVERNRHRLTPEELARIKWAQDVAEMDGVGMTVLRRIVESAKGRLESGTPKE